MAWAKIDDGWWAHPKVLGLTLSARGLWATALSWSCAQRKDRIPRQLVLMVAGNDGDDLANELTKAGLWEDDGDGWIVHDWADYQDRSLSEKRAEAGRKGGLRSGQSRRSKNDDDTPSDLHEHQADSKQTKQDVEADDEAGALPVPSRPKTPPRAHTRGPVENPPDETASTPGGGSPIPQGQGQPETTYGQQTIGRLPPRILRRLDTEPARALGTLHTALADAHRAGVPPGQVRAALNAAPPLDDADCIAAVAASRIRRITVPQEATA